MNRLPPKNMNVAVGCWLALMLVVPSYLLTPLTLLAATEPVDANVKNSIGIDGHYRVGRWVGIHTEPELAVASIETRDGDGVQVRYHRNAVSRNSSDWIYVIPGSEAAPLVFLKEDGQEGNSVVLQTRLPTLGSPSRGPAMIPSSMPWVLSLGDPMGIDQVGVNRLLDRDASIAVTRPRSAITMPDSVLGFDGIDLMVINAAGQTLLAELNPAQQQAVIDWVTGGGKVLMNLGERSSELLQSAPWLGKLVPVDSFDTTTITPSAIETYTSSQTPLQTFKGVRLPKDRGEVLIMGRDVRRISVPVAARYTVGFGKVIVVTADLESEQFAEWPERLDLISQLTGSTLTIDDHDQERVTRSTAYNDLAGQTRASLDRFSIQRTFSFSVLSLVLMALIAAIGPLDYLFINRVLGKPLLGWISFPVTAIGLSVLLASQSTVVGIGLANGAIADSTDTVRCNRIEIVDLDTVNGVGRGFSLNYLYTHEASRFDVDLLPTASLQAIAPKIDRSLAGPFGYPGESFGGIQISIEDARLPAYDVLRNVNASDLSRSLVGLPLAPRSSKGFFSEISFEPKLANAVVLHRRPGSELLQGDLVNPLPMDLLDAKLVFRNWVYLLPTRFRAGEKIARIDKLRQKNFRWLLSRQKALESATETQEWDPTSKNSISRIVEMLMFHEATGGTQYTNLENSPLAHLDLSDVLDDDHCILLGNVDGQLTSVNVSNGDQSSFIPSGEKLTMMRVVLPVTVANRR